MSSIALVTNNFDAMAAFYGEDLQLSRITSWDRPGARGCRFDLGGLVLELLDNGREASPLPLQPHDGRCHLQIEVDDIQAARARLRIASPRPVRTSWGADLFRVTDPDGTPVTFLQWHPGETR